MKKAISILLSLVLVFTLFACSNNSNDDTSSLDDSTQAVDSDKTDANNNNGGNDDTNTGTTGNNNGLPTAGDPTQEETTIPEPETMPTSKDKVEKTTNDEGMPIDANHLENLRKIMSGDEYTLSVAMHTEFEGMKLYVPATFYKEGKKSAMEFKLGLSSFLSAFDQSLASAASAYFTLLGINNIKVRVIDTPTNNYLVLDSMKKYQKISEEDSFDYMYNGTVFELEEARYTGTSTVEYKGDKYVCEEFETESGEIRTFYFLDGELKRVESKLGTQTSIVEFNEIKSSVDDSSVFTVPSNYTLLDEEQLG